MVWLCKKKKEKLFAGSITTFCVDYFFFPLVWSKANLELQPYRKTGVGRNTVQAPAQSRASFRVRSGCREQRVHSTFEILQQLRFHSLSESLFQCFTALFMNIFPP